MTTLHCLSLRNFRNYRKEVLQFDDSLTPLIGENGQGKTALLEAIAILSSGRSFRTTRLTDCIHYGENSFSLHADFSKNGISQKLSINYDGKSKRILHGPNQFSTFTALFGLIQTVAITPLDIELIHNTPQCRRRWLDLHLAQKDSIYLHQLARYSRALKQRNALLKQNTLKTIDLFEEQMVTSAQYISSKRKATLTLTKSLAQNFYRQLSEREDDIDFEYLHYKEDYRAALIKNRDKELLYGYTFDGPHKEDVLFLFNKAPAKEHASEGQKRLILLSIKLAEFSLLENPLLLIDDLGIHLDQPKQEKLFKFINTLPQVIYSSQFSPKNKSYYLIKEGLAKKQNRG